MELVELRQISLRRVGLSLRDAPAGRVFRLNLDELIGRSAKDKSLLLSLKGTVQRRPYSLTIKGPVPADLIGRGEPWPLSIKGKIVHSPLQGSFIYHPAHQKIKVGAELKLSAQNVNLGAVGRWLGLDKELRISAGDIYLDATLRGRSLAEVLKYSGFKLEVKDGLWRMREPSTQKPVHLTIKRGMIRSSRNKPISASLAGSLRNIPLDLEISSLKLADFAKPINRLPLSVKARMGKLKVRVDGHLASPLASGQSQFNFSLVGQRLDHMNPMLRVKLPGLGPYDISGRLGVSSAGYKLDGLKIHVGKSDLVGQASLTTPGKRPLLKMKLSANVLRLDDFIPPKLKRRHVRIHPGATSKNRTKPAKPAAKKEPGWEIKTDRQRNRIESILSHAVLNSLDGSLDLKVGQLLSGKDKLGGGLLQARLKDGRLDLNPVRLDIPGGSLKLTAAYQHVAGEVEAAITAKMDRFDYGVLARRMDPNSGMNGLVSVAVNLKSRAKERTDLMANASGRLIFAAWPKGRAAGLFDVWAINLLSAIVSDLTSKEKSKVNCLVCDLEMKDGVMKQRDIIIDTTKMRVKGEAEINFKTETVNAYLDPEAKKAQFFSLSAPIRIKGSFADFDTRIATGGMTTSAIRFLTSPFFAPLLRLFGDSPPADGHDVCVDPFRKLKAREEKEKE